MCALQVEIKFLIFIHHRHISSIFLIYLSTWYLIAHVRNLWGNFLPFPISKPPENPLENVSQIWPLLTNSTAIISVQTAIIWPFYLDPCNTTQALGWKPKINQYIRSQVKLEIDLLLQVPKISFELSQTLVLRWSEIAHVPSCLREIKLNLLWWMIK